MGSFGRTSAIDNECVNDGDSEQFNGREGETATLLSRCPLKLNGLGGGFAPRHLNRYALLAKKRVVNQQQFL